MLEDTLEERLEKAGALLSDSEKGEGEVKDAENEDNKVLFSLKPQCLFPSFLSFRTLVLLIEQHAL